MSIDALVAPKTDWLTRYSLLYPLCEWCEINDVVFVVGQHNYDRGELVVSYLRGAGYNCDYASLALLGPTDKDDPRMARPDDTQEPVLAAIAGVFEDAAQVRGARVSHPSTYLEFQELIYRKRGIAFLDLSSIDYSNDTYGYEVLLTYLEGELS